MMRIAMTAALLGLASCTEIDPGAASGPRPGRPTETPSAIVGSSSGRVGSLVQVEGLIQAGEHGINMWTTLEDLEASRRPGVQPSDPVWNRCVVLETDTLSLTRRLHRRDGKYAAVSGRVRIADRERDIEALWGCNPTRISVERLLDRHAEAEAGAVSVSHVLQRSHELEGSMVRVEGFLLHGDASIGLWTSQGDFLAVEQSLPPPGDERWKRCIAIEADGVRINRTLRRFDRRNVIISGRVQNLSDEDRSLWACGNTMIVAQSASLSS